MRSLHGRTAEAIWSLCCFLLAFTGSQPFACYATTRCSRECVLYIGLSLLAIGSVLCASAEAIAMFLFGRILQGIAAGATAAMTFSFMLTCASEREGRYVAMSTSVAWSIGTAIGPLLGGIWANESTWVRPAIL